MSEQLTFHRGGTNPDTGLEAARPKAEVGAARTATDHDASYLRVFVFAPFFFFSGITSLNDCAVGVFPHLAAGCGGREADRLHAKRRLDVGILAYGIYARRPAAAAARA
jgi:hypothetical protein